MELAELTEDRIGKEDRALVFYEQALVSDPVHQGARDARARLLSRRKAWKRLVEALQEERSRASRIRDGCSGHPAARVVRCGPTALGNSTGRCNAVTKRWRLSPGHVGALLMLEETHSLTI